MEQNRNITSWTSKKGQVLDQKQCRALEGYAALILEAGKHFNITGHRTLDEIVENLILGSLDPLGDINVPRGTFFCDLGTGGGIPGVPLAVLRSDIRGLLVDSSAKKTAFIAESCADLGIDNVESLAARVEEMGNAPEYRERFGLAVSRAMGSAYVLVESGAPLLCVGGLLYLYSSHTMEELHAAVKDHACTMGLDPVDLEDHERYGIGPEGLLFIKMRPVGDRYPRRYSVIKRESERVQ